MLLLLSSFFSRQLYQFNFVAHGFLQGVHKYPLSGIQADVLTASGELSRQNITGIGDQTHLILLPFRPVKDRALQPLRLSVRQQNHLGFLRKQGGKLRHKAGDPLG